jgi:hypothetical protein
VGRPDGRRPPGRSRPRWENNIKMQIKVEWVHGLVRFGSGQGEVAGSCECGNELPGSINCG